MEEYKLGKLKIEMPSGWHEVPYKTGLEIINTPHLTETKILALLSGQPVEVIRAASDPHTIIHFANAFTFIKRMPRNLANPEMPRSMKFRKDEILIMPYVVYQDKFDLGKSSTGQIEDMLLTMQDMAKKFLGETPEGEEPRPLTEAEQLEIIPFIVAIYLQKIVDRKYDYDRAMQMADDVMNSSFKDVVNIGYFFFGKLIGLKSGVKNSAQRPNLILRKLRRAYWILMQSLVSRLPSIH